MCMLVDSEQPDLRRRQPRSVRRALPLASAAASVAAAARVAATAATAARFAAATAELEPVDERDLADARVVLEHERGKRHAPAAAAALRAAAAAARRRVVVRERRVRAAQEDRASAPVGSGARVGRAGEMRRRRCGVRR